MATIAHHHSQPSYLAAAVALFLVFTLAPQLAAGDPLAAPLCGSSGNYTLNSTYLKNIQRLAVTMPRSTSSSPTLFAKNTSGIIPDMVYALALCRGDTNASVCSDCVASAFQDAQQLCAYNKDATVFDDTCLLRYSNQDFLTYVGDEFFILMNTRNVSTSTPGKKYVAIVVQPQGDTGGSVFIEYNALNVTAPFKVFDNAVGALVNATFDYAAADPYKRFGTGVEWFQSSVNIYSLAQCTPDMGQESCRTCLSGLTQWALKYFSGRRGGRVLGLRCNYRYEEYPFFSGNPLLQLPEPSVGTLAPASEPAPVPVPATVSGGGNVRGRVLAVILPIVVMMLAIVVVCYCLWRRKKKPAGTLLLIDSTNPEDIQSIDSLIIDLPTLRATTGNFDEGRKLGEGGFGAVYKVLIIVIYLVHQHVLSLSQSSRQGIKELKTELVLVAKLQHKNLVRLVGVCLEEHEKLLVYEYMPNNSLGTFLFDPDKSNELDWQRRFMIIKGIAQGLQYLHEESQLKIVHRDLKASNVLLDSDFNPKISDFGLARLFGSDQSQYVTNRVVGTYGYMAPEYAMRGHFSVKSDVFSFGVLMLEIVSGRRNGDCSSDDSEQYDHLLSSVWECWTLGTIVEIMDPSLSSHTNVDQMLKCIHIGLLCVQHNPADRPMMSTVNLMLSSSTLPRQAPSRPAFCFLRSGVNSEMDRGRGISHSTSRAGAAVSENEVTVTELEAR
ncbi:hypothetical protein BS78_02G301700 [Paspalum vaginatum]|nr:hypothetical protein BS78_02G301700 [Paspalum vaginatum]